MAVIIFLSAPCSDSFEPLRLTQFPGKPWKVTEHSGPFSHLFNWMDVPPPHQKL